MSFEPEFTGGLEKQASIRIPPDIPLNLFACLRDTFKSLGELFEMVVET